MCQLLPWESSLLLAEAREAMPEGGEKQEAGPPPDEPFSLGPQEGHSQS